MGARVACVAGGFKGLRIYEREIRECSLFITGVGTEEKLI